MAFWGIFWLAVLALAIWAVARWLGRSVPGRGPAAGPSAMEILRQRYARGEIDAPTFEQMRERLEGSRDPNTPVPSGR